MSCLALAFRHWKPLTGGAALLLTAMKNQNVGFTTESSGTCFRFTAGGLCEGGEDVGSVQADLSIQEFPRVGLPLVYKFQEKHLDQILF